MENFVLQFWRINECLRKYSLLLVLEWPHLTACLQCQYLSSERPRDIAVGRRRGRGGRIELAVVVVLVVGRARGGGRVGGSGGRGGGGGR